MLNDAQNHSISIHSLVKRETGFCGSVAGVPLYFNPLPRKEGDHDTNKIPLARSNFNPLPRKEGDQCRKCF